MDYETKIAKLETYIMDHQETIEKHESKNFLKIFWVYILPGKVKICINIPIKN